MPLTIPDGFAYSVVSWQLAGDPDPILTTLGTEWEGQVADPIDDVAAFVATTFDTFITQNMADVYTQTGVVSHGQDGLVTYAGDDSTVTNSATTIQVLPQNCAVLVKKKSNEVGKGKRGRFYLPAGFIGEAEVNAAGEIDTPDVAGLQALVDDLFDAFAARTPALDLFILHADILTSPGPPPVYTPSTVPPTRVSSLQVDNRVATQRRRLR